MPEITALILAAGLGIRMGPRGRLTPKGLIDVGGASLVRQSVETLETWGVDRIVIVTGHLAEQYHAEFDGDDVELVHNPDYSETGSLLTLKTGLEFVSGACLIVESDLIYAPQVLDQIDLTQNCFVTSNRTNAGDEVWVGTRTGKNDSPVLSQLSKNIADIVGTPLGEMVGLTYLTSDSIRLLRQATDIVLDRNPGAHYEECMVEVSKLLEIICPLTDGLNWAEIDDEAMLARVEQHVLPRVMLARNVHDNRQSR